jgi:hypothetical protein
LIDIKPRTRPFTHHPPATEDPVMPTDSAIVLAAVTLAFIVFAATLYWAESQTRDIRR